MTWGGGRSEIHKQLVVNNDQSSPELLLLLFRKHLKGDNYQSRLSLYARDLGGTSVEDMKSPKEDYEIRKSEVSNPGTGEDLLNFLSFYNLVI